MECPTAYKCINFFGVFSESLYAISFIESLDSSFLTEGNKYRTNFTRLILGHLVAHKWENCFNLDRYSWGYRRTMTSSDVRTMLELVNELARTIACGGNLLLNIGPTADGRVVAAFELRLRQLGRWLQTNGEAVYHTKPWIYQNDSNIWYFLIKYRFTYAYLMMMMNIDVHSLNQSFHETLGKFQLLTKFNFSPEINFKI